MRHCTSLASALFLLAVAIVKVDWVCFCFFPSEPCQSSGFIQSHSWWQKAPWLQFTMFKKNKSSRKQMNVLHIHNTGTAFTLVLPLAICVLKQETIWLFFKEQVTDKSKTKQNEWVIRQFQSIQFCTTFDRHLTKDSWKRPFIPTLLSTLHYVY